MPLPCGDTDMWVSVDNGRDVIAIPPLSSHVQSATLQELALARGGFQIFRRRMVHVTEKVSGRTFAQQRLQGRGYRLRHHRQGVVPYHYRTEIVWTERQRVLERQIRIG